MRIPAFYVPECCVSTRKDSQQSINGHVYLDAKKGRVLAANGSVAISIAVTDCEADVSGPIPSEAFGFARNLVKRDEFGVIELACNETSVVVKLNDVDQASFLRPKPENGKPLKFDTMMKKAKEPALNAGFIDPMFGVDEGDLKRVKKALGSKVLRIQVTAPGNMLVVLAEARNEAEALVARASVETAVKPKSRPEDEPTDAEPKAPVAKTNDMFDGIDDEPVETTVAEPAPAESEV